MASVYQQGTGPWLVDDTVVLCDGDIALTQFPAVDGHGGATAHRARRRKKTDPRVHEGYLLRMRPRR
jgi:hypothetical protein